MPTQELKSLDDYEVFLAEKLTLWSWQQRVALAAAIAEHWLPAYEAFSAAEEWGDPAALRRSLEAVWGHVQGRALSRAQLARHIEQIDDVTPHLDDFDAEDALTACAALVEALHSCGEAEDALPYATRTALGVFEALIQEEPLDPASQRRVWQKKAIRQELQTQLKLIEEIDVVATFDAAAIQKLKSLASLKVKTPARARPKGPSTI